MNFLKAVQQTVIDFANEEDGAQVVEYALVIALVSIGLALALSSAMGTGAGSAFFDLVTRVKACFATNATSC
jgi:pilus assembly protein Flp/PilA